MHNDERSPSASTGTSRYSRRQFLQLGMTLTAGLIATACTPWADNFLAPIDQLYPTPSTIPGQEEIQLVYQDWRADWFPEMVEVMLAQFHDTHPGIRVFFTPDPDNLADRMHVDMQMGTAPDVFWGGSTFFPTWAQHGYMVDLRPYVEANLDETTIAEWDPAQYAAFFLKDGQQFGLPKYHGAVALYYNKDLFDANGVDYPTDLWTYEAYLDAMHRLSDHGANSSGSGSERTQWGSMIDITWDRLQIHANAWGGHLIAPYNTSQCVADKPKAAAAFEWLRARIWGDHVMASFADVQYMSPRSAFINQRVAMVEEGSWMLKDILKKSDFRVGVALLPKGPKRRVALATTDGFGIYVGTQYPDAAWELVKFLTGHDYGLAMAKANLLQPAHASLIEDWIGFVRTEFPLKAQDLNLIAFADGHLNGYSVTTEIAENMSEVQPRLTEAFETIFTLGQAPVNELQAICAQLNQWQRDEHILYPRLAY